MKYFDIFNGDADGICALHQLRLRGRLARWLQCIYQQAAQGHALAQGQGGALHGCGWECAALIQKEKILGHKTRWLRMLIQRMSESGKGSLKGQKR